MTRRSSFLVWLVSLPAIALSQAPGASPWQAIGVANLSLELVSDETIQLLDFRPDGRVVVSVGAKNGPVIGPIWFWRLDSGHLLLARQPGGKPHINLHDPKIEGGTLRVVQGDGESLTYRVKRSAP